MAEHPAESKESHSVEDTISLGEKLGSGLQAGDILALVGDLGAGKTHLSKGIVQGLGSSDEVSSPTFTLVHEYTGGRFSVAHFDWYRMESVDEAIAIGWEEYVDEFEGVMIVEWADKFPGLLPEHTQWWKLIAPSAGTRLLSRIEQPEARPC